MRILITAGPTREPIDLVRFVGNRSSGKMGLALAEAAVEAGHETTVLLGPVGVAPPEGCKTYRFESTAELKQLLEAHWRDHDVLIMAAAVADYRPIEVHEGKLPRNPVGTLTLVLHSTPDLSALMASSKRPGQRVIAFALEEKEHLEERAIQKMRRKGVDAIVANPLGTMESDGITPVWLTADARREAPGRMSKADFAKWLIRKLDEGCH
jgi:phosphopantothenoylcysteine decarboxylase / phosphopantothenate---cysteine ligase